MLHQVQSRRSNEKLRNWHEALAESFSYLWITHKTLVLLTV